MKINTQEEMDAVDINYSGIINVVGNVYRINKFYPNAEIRISDNAKVTYVYGNATVTNVYGNATVTNVSDNACVLFVDGNAKVSTKGKNIVSYWNDRSVQVDASKNTTIVILDRFKATWGAYEELYPIEVKKGIATIYKAVHKRDEKFFSHYNSCYEYKIGKKLKEECDTDKSQECSYGIHVSHKMWALKFGAGWSDMAILELEVDTKKIVVPTTCDGKVRTSEAKVIREVPHEEWYL